MVWAVVPARVGVFAFWICDALAVLVGHRSEVERHKFWHIPAEEPVEGPDVSQPTGKKIDSECPRAPAEPRTHAG